MIARIYEGDLNVLNNVHDPQLLIMLGQYLSNDIFDDNLESQKNIDKLI